MSMLSAETICDIDTITLEELIEPLRDNLAPQKQQLLALCLIELEERYAVEEFGFKLAYGSDQDFINTYLSHSNLVNQPYAPSTFPQPSVQTSKLIFNPPQAYEQAPKSKPLLQTPIQRRSTLGGSTSVQSLLRYKLALYDRLKPNSAVLEQKSSKFMVQAGTSSHTQRDQFKRRRTILHSEVKISSSGSSGHQMGKIVSKPQSSRSLPRLSPISLSKNTTQTNRTDVHTPTAIPKKTLPQMPSGQQASQTRQKIRKSISIHVIRGPLIAPKGEINQKLKKQLKQVSDQITVSGSAIQQKGKQANNVNDLLNKMIQQKTQQKLIESLPYAVSTQNNTIASQAVQLKNSQENIYPFKLGENYQAQSKRSITNNSQLFLKKVIKNEQSNDEVCQRNDKTELSVNNNFKATSLSNKHQSASDSHQLIQEELIHSFSYNYNGQYTTNISSESISHQKQRQPSASYRRISTPRIRPAQTVKIQIKFQQNDVYDQEIVLFPSNELEKSQRQNEQETIKQEKQQKQQLEKQYEQPQKQYKQPQKQQTTTNHINALTIIQSQKSSQLIVPLPSKSLVQEKRPSHLEKKIISPYFAYHQFIGSFGGLFPGAKSHQLLTVVKQTIQCLKLHFSRKIGERTQANALLSASPEAVAFQAVTNLANCEKYRNLFNLDLSGFEEHCRTLVGRTNGSVNPKADYDVMLYRVARTKQDVYDIITVGFHRTPNWCQLPHGIQASHSWNLLWTWSKPQIDPSRFLLFQKVNHFFGNKQIARKDLLKKNIYRLKKVSPKLSSLFDIMPQTYYLPGENLAFACRFREVEALGTLWIMKPVGLSRGRGISVIKSLSEVVFSEPVVVQRYLPNPLLLDGYKFDMRVYVLVCSINPLEAYVYKDGFARISTQPYSNDKESLSNRFIHLTNYSVNRQNVKLQTAQEIVGGPKITLKTLSQRLGNKWSQIEPQIDSIVIKSLLATMDVIPANPCCFELFGYDIIPDQDLRCWLLQVNSSPSLEREFILDQILKQQLVDDIIEMVSPIRFDRSRLLEVLDRRRKELEGLKSHVNHQNNSAIQLDSDMHYVFHGRPLQESRRIGGISNWRQVAPGSEYGKLLKAVQAFRRDPIQKIGMATGSFRAE